MSKCLEPQKVQITPVYICDSCKSSHYESIDYVNKIGKILCCCGAVISLKPISTFQVKPVYVNVERSKKRQDFIDIENDEDASTDDEICFDNEEEPLLTTPPPIHHKKEVSNHSNLESEELLERAIDFLLALGYKKSESKKIIKRKAGAFPHEVTDNNFEDFAKSLLFD